MVVLLLQMLFEVEYEVDTDHEQSFLIAFLIGNFSCIIMFPFVIQAMTSSAESLGRYTETTAKVLYFVRLPRRMMSVMDLGLLAIGL